jgi:hypothetical protein
VKQEWIWITPGSVFATVVWLLISLGFRWYVGAFANYQATYGAIGGVIVALLWLYVSALAILMGATMNAIIEHASPLGKDEGEKAPGEKEAHGGVPPHAAQPSPRAAPSGAHDDDRSLVPVASTARPDRHRGRPRPSDLVIGGLGVALELGAVVAMQLRRLRNRA